MQISEYRNNLCVENQILLAKIEKQIPVVFEKSERNCWQASIRKSKGYAVVYCMDYFSDNKIAHELLHIETDLIMGDNRIMLNKCGKNPILHWLFLNENNDAASQILNAYEHLVILPKYEKMGFDKNDFFEDQKANRYEDFVNKVEQRGIRKPNGKISCQDFIIAFVCIMSYLFWPIDDRFNRQLAILKKSEKELFGIFKSFKDQLIKVPINKKGRQSIQLVYAWFMTTLDKYITKNCDTNEDFYKNFPLVSINK
ncbi:MAG: hypothetical protein ACI4V5_02960 [Prevotella sp.]